MAKRRPEGFDLRAAIRSPAFTPAGADVPPLLDAVCGDDEAFAAEAERALLRVGAPAGRAALERLGRERPPARGKLAHVVGRLAQETGDAGLGDAVETLLLDEDAKTRRNAVIALGKLARPGAEAALLAAWEREPRVDHRRSIAAALGKVGGEPARALLSSLHTDDAELARIAAEARAVIERNLAAASPSGIDAEAAPARPLAGIARCRRGLEELLADELRDFAPEVRGPGEVSFLSALPPAALWRARTMLDFAYPLPVERGEAAEAIARALSSAAARAVLGAFARGTVRYRIAWAGGGKKRAAVFRAVAAVARAAPSLVNDPSRRDWEVLVDERDGRVQVALQPRLPDPRFAWRVADVPAASHPTVAAALARVAGARAGDVVWDPFVGSGAELIERALLGGVARAHGSDHDERALAAARANLAAAGVAAELVLADALAPPPAGVSLIITNPPMGLRVHRRADLAELLEKFVAHAARSLVGGGRMVWISPFAERTEAAAIHARMRMDYSRRIDMGGFAATIQRFRK